MNTGISKYTLPAIVTCRKCWSTVAQRGSLFCDDCNRELFPQDYEDQDNEHCGHEESAVHCKCCGLPIVVEFQERRVKTPLLLITCRNDACPLDDVTIAVETAAEYRARDLSDKMECNR